MTNALYRTVLHRMSLHYITLDCTLLHGKVVVLYYYYVVYGVVL